jgi:hypothetical protein
VSPEREIELAGPHPIYVAAELADAGCTEKMLAFEGQFSPKPEAPRASV